MTSRSDAPVSTDQRLGEGFAFFRWHCLRWRWAFMPLRCQYSNGCGRIWDEIQREHKTALRESQS